MGEEREMKGKFKLIVTTFIVLLIFMLIIFVVNLLINSDDEDNMQMNEPDISQNIEYNDEVLDTDEVNSDEGSSNDSGHQNSKSDYSSISGNEDETSGDINDNTDTDIDTDISTDIKTDSDTGATDEETNPIIRDEDFPSNIFYNTDFNITYSGSFNHIAIDAVTLNLRDKPSEDSNIIGSVNKSELYPVLDINTQETTDWFLIQVSNVEGFVSGDYVDVQEYKYFDHNISEDWIIQDIVTYEGTTFLLFNNPNKYKSYIFQLDNTGEIIVHFGVNSKNDYIYNIEHNESDVTVMLEHGNVTYTKDESTSSYQIKEYIGVNNIPKDHDTGFPYKVTNSRNDQYFQNNTIRIDNYDNQLFVYKHGLQWYAETIYLGEFSSYEAIVEYNDGDMLIGYQEPNQILLVHTEIEFPYKRDELNQDTLFIDDDFVFVTNEILSDQMTIGSNTYETGEVSTDRLVESADTLEYMLRRDDLKFLDRFSRLRNVVEYMEIADLFEENIVALDYDDSHIAVIHDDFMMTVYDRASMNVVFTQTDVVSVRIQESKILYLIDNESKSLMCYENGNNNLIDNHLREDYEVLFYANYRPMSDFVDFGYGIYEDKIYYIDDSRLVHGLNDKYEQVFESEVSVDYLIIYDNYMFGLRYITEDAVICYQFIDGKFVMKELLPLLMDITMQYSRFFVYDNHIIYLTNMPFYYFSGDSIPVDELTDTYGVLYEDDKVILLDQVLACWEECPTIIAVIDKNSDEIRSVNLYDYYTFRDDFISFEIKEVFLEQRKILVYEESNINQYVIYDFSEKYSLPISFSSDLGKYNVDSGIITFSSEETEEIEIYDINESEGE